MCAPLHYDGRVIHTIDELRRLLGDAHVMVRSGYALDAYSGTSCLCPVDLDATGAVLGRKVIWEYGMDVWFLTDAQIAAGMGPAKEDVLRIGQQDNDEGAST